MQNPSKIYGWAIFDAIDGLTRQSRTQMNSKILQIETSVKGKLDRFSSPPDQRRCRNEPVREVEHGWIEEEEEEEGVEIEE